MHGALDGVPRGGWPGLGLDLGAEVSVHIQLGFVQGMRDIVAIPPAAKFGTGRRPFS